jgi:transcriptional antiterminator NusG
MSNEESPYKWYVVRAISGQEKKVEARIKTELAKMNLEHYVPKILIPIEKVFQVKNGKKTSKEKNLFPGYILIEADLRGEVLPTIKSVNGVVGFLKDAKGPVPMRLSEINRLLGVADLANEMGEQMAEPFLIGETVKVIDGPFNGFTGEIKEVHEDKKKLNVMVKIFGRPTPIELGFMQVEKVS